MDSLIASYASSSDDEEERRGHLHQTHQSSPVSAIDAAATAQSLEDEDEDDQLNLRAHTKPFSLPKPQSSHSSSSASLFASLPKPQSSSSFSSLFSSLPPPSSSIRAPSISSISTAHVGVKDEEEEPDVYSSSGMKGSSLLFSSLPKPKSDHPGGDEIVATTSLLFSLPPPKVGDGVVNSSSLGQKGRKVIQFRPPIGLSSVKKDVDDDDDEEEEEEERKKPQEFQSASVKSFLSSIPAPKNSSTLGVLPSSTSGHRLVLDEEKPSAVSDVNSRENEVVGDYNTVADQSGGIDGSNQSSAGWAPPDQNYAGYESYGSYENYVGRHGVESYGSYQGSWDYGSSAGMTTETPVAVESFIKASGKRGRDVIPTEMVEVKQDELIKDRPREDQVKLTGIAFGPAYQPASSKMKPSKLHKRKHQIGSLFFDMKQKEMELAERRSRGFLTKAETQAKYGW